MNDWKTVLQPGWLNAFWFLIVYLLILMIQPYCYKKGRAILKRLTTSPEKKNWEKMRQ